MPIFQQPYAERRQLLQATLLLTLLTLALAGLLLTGCHRTRPSTPALTPPPVAIDTLRNRLAAEQYQRIQTADSAIKHANPTVTDYENTLKRYDANPLVLP